MNSYCKNLKEFIVVVFCFRHLRVRASLSITTVTMQMRILACSSPVPLSGTSSYSLVRPRVSYQSNDFQSNFR